MQRAKAIINKGAPFVLFVYLLIGIMAYVNIWPGSAKYFYSSSLSGIIFRAISTGIICLYCVFLFLLNRNKIRFPVFWLVAMVSVLAVNFIVMMLARHEYAYLYVSSLYSRLHEVVAVTGYRTLLTMYLSSISDFALGFCFLFLLPFGFKEKKQLLILTIPMILFLVYECGYSVIQERMEYVGIFSGETDTYGGYNISIGATFGDKQEFGCFLTVAFCCALVSFFCFDFIERKPIRTLCKTGVAFCCVLFFIITFFTLCKTAIISNIVALLCAIIAFCIFCFKKHRVTFFAFVSMVAVIGIAITLILTVEQLHSTGILASFYQLVNSLFLSKVNHGIWSRFFLIEAFFNSLDTLGLVFGFSKGGLNGFMRAATVEGQAGLHTGFIYFQGCYGLFGSILYFVLFFIVVRNIVLLLKKEIGLGLLVLGAFLCSLIFNLAECEVLIISGSATVFLFNVICVTFTKGYLGYAENRT